MNERNSIARSGSAARQGSADRRADENGRAVANAALCQLLGRLTHLLDAEREEMRADPSTNLSRFIELKGRALVELGRAWDQRLPGPLSDDVVAHLQRLKTAADLNAAMLAGHLASLEEMTEILAEAIRQLMSDGTYSPLAAKRGSR